MPGPLSHRGTAAGHLRKEGTEDVDAARAEIVDELNRLMAEEVEACLRYFHMRFRLAPRDVATAEPLFGEAIRETLEHAEAIARRIRSLGHVPTLRVSLALGGEPVRLEGALGEVLAVEQQALDAYTDFLPRVTGDPPLEEFIRGQIAVETEHVGEIREFIRARAGVRVVPKPNPTE